MSVETSLTIMALCMMVMGVAFLILLIALIVLVVKAAGIMRKAAVFMDDIRQHTMPVIEEVQITNKLINERFREAAGRIVRMVEIITSAAEYLAANPLKMAAQLFGRLRRESHHNP